MNKYVYIYLSVWRVNHKIRLETTTKLLRPQKTVEKFPSCTKICIKRKYLNFATMCERAKKNEAKYTYIWNQTHPPFLTQSPLHDPVHILAAMKRARVLLLTQHHSNTTHCTQEITAELKKSIIYFLWFYCAYTIYSPSVWIYMRTSQCPFRLSTRRILFKHRRRPHHQPPRRFSRCRYIYHIIQSCWGKSLSLHYSSLCHYCKTNHTLGENMMMKTNACCFCCFVFVIVCVPKNLYTHSHR